MDHYHKFYVRISFKGLFQCFRRHVPGIILGVNKYRFSALINHRIHRGVKSHVRAKHPPSVKTAASAQPVRRGDTGTASVQPFRRQFNRQVNGRRAAAQRYTPGDSYVFADCSFQRVDIFPNRTHPVCLIGLGHIPQFFPMHRGGRQIYFMFKGFNPLKFRIRF